MSRLSIALSGLVQPAPKKKLMLMIAPAKAPRFVNSPSKRERPMRISPDNTRAARTAEFGRTTDRRNSAYQGKKAEGGKHSQLSRLGRR